MILAAPSPGVVLPTWHSIDDGCESPSPRADRSVNAGADAAAQLVSSAQAGHRESFAQLVRLRADRLYAVVIRVVSDPDQADEVVHETFVRARCSLGRFEGRWRSFTWLRDRGRRA
jgi:hypothetical protein